MPVFLIGGWYDNYAAEAVTTFLGLREHAPTAALRDSHRLLIGPWTHGINSTTRPGRDRLRPAGPGRERRHLPLAGLHPARPAMRPAFQRAPIRLFVLGANDWRDEYEWPLARTRCDPLLLAGAVAG